METRTFNPIGRVDLKAMVEPSLAELDRFLHRAGSPGGKFAAYADRLIAICLCQGAAQHFVDMSRSRKEYDKVVMVSTNEIDQKRLQVLPDGRVLSGVKDVDICIFCEHDDRVPIQKRNHCIKRQYITFDRLGSRPVDFLKKGVQRDVLNKAASASARDAVMAYMANTDHGRELALKSVVGLYPQELFGRVLWATRRLTVETAHGVN